MKKVYTASTRNDAELEKLIYGLDAYFLRIALYGIARGDSFDDSVSLAEHAAQQSAQDDDGFCHCREPLPSEYIGETSFCSYCHHFRR